VFVDECSLSCRHAVLSWEINLFIHKFEANGFYDFIR
jgi:hypothetical protein